MTRKASNKVTDSSVVIHRQHPCSPETPYCLDVNLVGFHVPGLPLFLLGSILTFTRFTSAFENLPLPSAIRREQDIYRIARGNARIGYVYDLPTVVGWATFQKPLLVSFCLSSLINSTSILVSVPPSISRVVEHGDDIRPDLHSLPETNPHTQLLSILYEALDSLLMSLKVQNDVHLRNIYPYSLWQSGVVFSQGQCRKLAPVAPPPRVFTRSVECPIVGEVLAAEGVVKCDGWVTFYQALVPSFIEGGVEFEHHRIYKRFIPRSDFRQIAKPASLLVGDLTQAELYYLARLERFGSPGDTMKATLHRQGHRFYDRSLGLMEELLDNEAMIQALGVRLESAGLRHDPVFNTLSSSACIQTRALMMAEQLMCNRMDNDHDQSENSDTESGQDFSFIFKRDARLELSTLDGYDAWCDEQLKVKKYKTWAEYRPRSLLPAEVAALYADKGIRLQSYGTSLQLFDENKLSAESRNDGTNNVVIPDVSNWSDLRPLLDQVGPSVPHAADSFVLMAVMAGQLMLVGYFHCADPSELRHTSRCSTIFMDAPLFVLAFKCQQSDVRGRKDHRSCLLIPVGPACTMLMEYVTEKYTTRYGTVYHSSHVSVFPFGCRLGDRSQLKWYAVGCGKDKSKNDDECEIECPFITPTEAAPTSLLQMTQKVCEELACSFSSETDHIVVTARKGVFSLRLRDIGFEAGWTGFSPHLILTGKGKRITSSVKAYSLTHLVDVLRKIRDKSKSTLSTHLSIQEIAGMVILKEVLIGPLRIVGQQSWAPLWKCDNGQCTSAFVVAHSFAIPPGISVKNIEVKNNRSEQFGLLVTQDTMAVFEWSPGQIAGVWRWVFIQIDASIESEKLLYGPEFEGFVRALLSGQIDACPVV